jgi:hypothetical protein
MISTQAHMQHNARDYWNVESLQRERSAQMISNQVNAALHHLQTLLLVLRAIMAHRHYNFLESALQGCEQACESDNQKSILEKLQA